MKEEGNLTGYLKELWDKYNELKSQGKDLYYFEKASEKHVFALPIKEVEYNEDDFVIMTPQIEDILKNIFTGTRRKYLRDKPILPYKDIEARDSFSLKDLEHIIEEGGYATVFY
jgi:hypothetical protein